MYFSLFAHRPDGTEEESEELNEMHDKDQCKKCKVSITGQTSFSCSETEKTCLCKRAQKTGTKSHFNLPTVWKEF